MFTTHNSIFVISCQIDEDFQQLFGEQAGNFTARWEIVAPLLLNRIKLDCYDDTAVRLIAELNNPQLTGISGIDNDEEDMDVDYSPTTG